MKRSPGAPPVDPAACARASGLAYVSDRRPGIRRRGVAGRFRYVDAAGRPVRDAATLRRIAALAVPPAWRDVWICPSPRGHVQATGRDARGRKQYRYHARWRSARDETKFHRAIAFAEALPRIRARVAADLARPGLRRRKVIATVVRLLETTFLRVGNEEYARQNESFGLTTLRDQHADVDGGRVRFTFRGKAGKLHRVLVRDRRIAAIVRRCQDLPGEELFQYEADDGRPHAIGSSDVNAYLREISGEAFSAKDFRTWAGTVLAAVALALCPPCRTRTAAKRSVVRAVAEAAERLGNTPAVCRKAYIHPAVFEAFLEGVTIALPASASGAAAAALRPEERAVLELLRARASADGALRATG